MLDDAHNRGTVWRNTPKVQLRDVSRPKDYAEPEVAPQKGWRVDPWVISSVIAWAVVVGLAIYEATR